MRLIWLIMPIVLLVAAGFHAWNERTPPLPFTLADLRPGVTTHAQTSAAGADTSDERSTKVTATR